MVKEPGPDVLRLRIDSMTRHVWCDRAAEISQQALVVRIIAQQFMAGLDQFVNLLFSSGKSWSG